jgi:hypothetical protein
MRMIRIVVNLIKQSNAWLPEKQYETAGPGFVFPSLKAFRNIAIGSRSIGNSPDRARERAVRQENCRDRGQSKDAHRTFFSVNLVTGGETIVKTAVKKTPAQASNMNP